MLGGERATNDLERPRPDDFGVDDDQHGSVRSIGIEIHSDVADFDENEDQLTSMNYDSWQDRNSTGNSQTGHSSCEDQDTVKHVVKGRDAKSGGLKFGGFSFPSPSRTSDAIERDDILASWRRKRNESSLVLSSRTRFEEDKIFHVVLNSVIAGHYH
ncbi:hypothetical protein KI387_000927, partial [Taxus chinensis]